MGQVQALAGAGHPHVAEPALLLHAGLVLQRAEVGEHPLFHPHQEDDGKLQPLGAVDRHEDHGVRRVLIGIGVRHQGHRLQEGLQRRHAVPGSREQPAPGFELSRHGEEFLQVLHPA